MQLAVNHPPEETFTKYGSGKRQLPPMLEQYLDFKSRYPDALILFQVGDFYEIFFDDALTAAGVLNLTLTSRDKNDPNPIPMCGVPISVIDTYLDRLVNAGYSVAIISQVGEVPAKGMVKRDLERVVTPGLRILSEAQGKRAVVSGFYFATMNSGAVSFLDIEKGILAVKEGISFEEAVILASKQQATECVVYNEIDGERIDRRNSKLKQLELISKAPVKLRGKAFEQSQSPADIKGFDQLSSLGRKAAQMLTGYVLETTISINKTIKEILPLREEGLVYIDPTTRANLELIQTLRNGAKKGTLYDVLDLTSTCGGQKLLQQWISAPLQELEKINQRHAAVEQLIAEEASTSQIAGILNYAPDIERIATRILIGVAGPKEFATLRDFLVRLGELRELAVRVFAEIKSSALTKELITGLQISPGIVAGLNDFFIDNPNKSQSEGLIVRDGYNEEVDRLRKLKTSGKSWISDLEVKERERTGISSLKIKYHRVIGYYIEISNNNLGKVPPDYQRRQSTATGERFILPHLKEMESEVLNAESKQNSLEEKLFIEFRQQFAAYSEELRTLADSIAQIDVLAGFSILAIKERYIKPMMTQGLDLKISAGKHPVISQFLGHQFIPNSIDFNEASSGQDADQAQPLSFILTGPNMGGKSTFLRQIALITIMAQIGSYVPAQAATIGIVDRIFARIGASDNLLEGESTFMVEMKEAALILSGATKRSLVLIDEIGRGTSTRDGEAIATAIFEWLVKRISCRNLFATHFKNLTGKFSLADFVENLSVSSVEEKGEIIFTHEIQKGSANESYGIEVARMAGLPEQLILRARQILAETPAAGQGSAPAKQLKLALNLGNTPPVRAVEPKLPFLKDSNCIKKIAQLELDSLTPLQALNLLSELKEQAQKEIS